MWMWMWLSLLGALYLASASLVGYVVYQDRANAAQAHMRQRATQRDPRSTTSPEMVFSTRY
jgi:hypothetical protein